MLLRNACGIEIEITSDVRKVNAAQIPVINYSSESIENTFTMKPHSLLSEIGIRDYVIEVGSDPVFRKVFFKSSRSDIPFDIFAASFWLLSRYEEYLPHKTDKYNRFHYKSSLAYQYDFLEIPLINLWLDQFKVLLKDKFPQLDFKKRDYNYVSTVDIDNAYRYLHKGMVRTFAGFLRDIIKRDFKSIRERFQILSHKKNDPFDAYEFLIKVHREKNVNAIYFFLLGDYGVNDKNISANNYLFQELIKHLSDYSAVGIHPSFGSNNNLQKLKVEISRLANITHIPVTKSRQHYSMLMFPKTYQDLLLSGISDDYSMGYTNRNGFRASFCYPFNWYSLDDEQEMALKIHPFCITENTLVYYSGISNKTFCLMAEPLIESVKMFGGELVSIFHNDTFDDKMKENYLTFLEKAMA